jgi:imidazolonepropionase-like amidohydrolase
MASQPREAASPPGSGKLALTNVRVFDGSQLIPGGTVVISGGRIGTDPAGAQVIDGDGGVLLPGLIDAHVHLDGPGRLAALVGYGVTTALDMASVPEETDALRGQAGLTDVRSAGIPAIAPGSFHSRIPGVGERGLIAGPDEAKRFVADRVAEGSDYIKIVIGSPFADHEQATIDALVAAAHEHGKLVVAHASSVESVAKAQAAGTDILTHAPRDGVLDPAAVAQAVAAGRGADARHDGGHREQPRPAGRGLRLLAGQRSRAAGGGRADPGRHRRQRLARYAVAGAARRQPAPRA